MADESVRSLFDVPEDIAYLNSANIGPRLKSVSKAGRRAIDRFARPWTIQPKDWFSGPEELRTEMSRLLEVPADRISLVPSVSYGVAIAVKNLPVSPGSRIVLVHEQYPSNVYAWRRKASECSARVVTALKGPNVRLTDSVLDSIDQRTDVVAIPNCHWTDGEILDLAAISDACRSVGARLVVDASQSLGVRPIMLSKVKPDFVISVGYKWLLGPYGLAYLYADEEWCNTGVPLEESWLCRQGSEDFSNLVRYTDEYRPGARRFDFGEYPQFISIPMALAAISQMNAWGMAEIRHRVSQHIETVREVCAELELAVLPRDRSSDHMIGVPLETPERARQIAGAMSHSRVITSQRGSVLRVSPHMHSVNSDVERFCEVLRVHHR